MRVNYGTRRTTPPAFVFPRHDFWLLTHLLECTCLDLPDALSRHVEFGREIFQSRWLLGQMSRLEDTTFALVEHANRVD